MGLFLTAAPAVEPVTVDEAKMHLRIDQDEEDTLLASLIAASRLQIEAVLDVALITQSWSLELDTWPDSRELHVPLWPVQSVEAVQIMDQDGEVVDLCTSALVLDGASKPPRLVSTAGNWPEPGVPALGIEIGFTAGFGNSASDVPAPIKQALLMLVAHWYEHREPSETGKTVTPIPDAISALLMPFRTVRL